MDPIVQNLISSALPTASRQIHHMHTFQKMYVALNITACTSYHHPPRSSPNKEAAKLRSLDYRQTSVFVGNTLPKVLCIPSGAFGLFDSVKKIEKKELDYFLKICITIAHKSIWMKPSMFQKKNKIMKQEVALSGLPRWLPKRNFLPTSVIVPIPVATYRQFQSN
ncbi:hypothetical protein BDZ91DRAFT_817268 [Kalaharituber pfeilii]|nr:hypothetical protein BDZ91DRAFT_817268 [Kalaharituber pfeilii]